MRESLFVILAMTTARLALADDNAPLVVDAAVRACDGGAIADCVRLGEAFRIGRDGVKQDSTRARHYFERACTLGDGRIAACTTYADMLNSGHTSKRDEVKARAVLNRACKGREASACSYLGLIHTEGLGVPYTLDEKRIGVSFYQKACDLNHGGGCWHLGLLLRDGIAIKKDLAAARTMFEKACKAGESVACDDLKK